MIGIADDYSSTHSRLGSYNPTDRTIPFSTTIDRGTGERIFQSCFMAALLREDHNAASVLLWFY